MWNSALVSTASGGMLFLPSYFFPHTCPAHLGNLFLLLLLFSPPHPSNCSKHLYICLFLSPTLLPLCLLVTPLLSLLHSHSGALQVSRLTSFSSLLVNTYPCFSPRITPVSPPTADARPLSPCLQLLEIPRLCPFLFHPPATLRAKSISFYHPFTTASAILGDPVGSLIVFHF